MRVGKNESIYNYLAKNHPELIQDEYFRPHDTAVIEYHKQHQKVL
jgi:ribonucleoside-diphosphate reductase alpha chain